MSDEELWIRPGASVKKIRRFGDGMRVLVRAVGQYAPDAVHPPRLGTVVRLRRGDDGAWVALDERDEALCPFPDDDPRRTHVITFPQFCEVPP